MKTFKEIKFNYHQLITFIGVILFVFVFSDLLAQNKPVRVFMYLNYFQNDTANYLHAETKYREKGTFYQIEGIEISFFQENEEGEELIGKVTTAENGFADLDLSNKMIMWDTSGFAHFSAQFKGNEQFRRASGSIDIKKIELVLDTEVVDSVHHLIVSGYEIIGADKVPIDGEGISVFVKRLYSDLLIQESSFDEGRLTIEFPADIPGNTFGDIWVMARITEHDDYGNVETRQKLRWGVPVSYMLEEKPRALWSRAPLWIIIGVWTALLILWGYYFIAISKLFGMRNL